jgi:hypothetical protein
LESNEFQRGQCPHQHQLLIFSYHPFWIVTHKKCYN